MIIKNIRKQLLQVIFLFALIWAFDPVFAVQNRIDVEDTGLVSVQASGMKLGDLLTDLGNKTGIRFKIEESIANQEISISIHKKPPLEAIKKIVFQKNYSVLFDDAGNVIEVSVVGNSGSAQNSNNFIDIIPGTISVEEKVHNEPITLEAAFDEEGFYNDPPLPAAGYDDEEEVYNDPPLPDAGNDEEEVYNDPPLPDAGNDEEEVYNDPPLPFVGNDDGEEVYNDPPLPAVGNDDEEVYNDPLLK